MKKIIYFGYTLLLIQIPLNSIEILEAEYNSLIAGAGLLAEQIGPINSYLKDQLISSKVIDISLDEEDVMIHGRIDKAGGKYLIVLSITDFSINKEIGSFSHEFISLKEYMYVINSLVARIEGRSLKQDENDYDISIDLSFSEQTIKPITRSDIILQNTTTTFIDKNQYTDSGIERMSVILNEKLDHYYILFNQEEYSETVTQVIAFLHGYSEMTNEYQKKLSTYRIEASKLQNHAQQRIEINGIRNEINQIINREQYNQKEDYERLESIITKLDESEWIDQEAIDSFIFQINELSDYYSYAYIMYWLNRCVTDEKSDIYTIINEMFNNAYSHHKNHSYQDIELEIKIEEQLSIVYESLIQILSNIVLSEFNLLLVAEEYDRAYERIESYRNVIEKTLFTVPDLSISAEDADKILAELNRICDNIAKSKFDEFEFNLNYYRYDKLSEEICVTYRDFNTYARKSIYQERYYKKFLELFREDKEKYLNHETYVDIDNDLDIQWALKWENSKKEKTKERKQYLNGVIDFCVGYNTVGYSLAINGPIGITYNNKTKEFNLIYDLLGFHLKYGVWQSHLVLFPLGYDIPYNSLVEKESYNNYLTSWKWENDIILANVIYAGFGYSPISYTDQYFERKSKNLYYYRLGLNISRILLRKDKKLALDPTISFEYNYYPEFNNGRFSLSLNLFNISEYAFNN